MKLGIINDWNKEGFAYAKSKGLSFLEFCVNYNYNVDEFTAKLPEIKKLSQEYGVSVGSMGRWGIDRIKKDGTIDENEFRNNLKLIDACAFLGCPVFVCGCNYTSEKSFEEKENRHGITGRFLLPASSISQD
jgi:sugar phosphate isomerase/epimerase